MRKELIKLMAGILMNREVNMTSDRAVRIALNIDASVEQHFAAQMPAWAKSAENVLHSSSVEEE